MQDQDHNHQLKTAFDTRYQSMDNEISSFLPHWQEIADYISPRIARIGAAVTSDKGCKANQRILDPTATLAVRILKSGLMAGLTSPSRPWFRILPVDPDLAKRATVKSWCWQVEQLMRDVFSHSNLYMCLPMVYGDLAMPGTAAMFEIEDPERRVRFYPAQLGTYRIAIDDMMRADTIYRKLAMTCQQIIQMFGFGNCSQTIQSSWTNSKPQQQYEVMHVIERNDDRKPGLKDARNMPYRSVWYETGSFEGKFLRESGFPEFPFFCPRWDVFNANDAYGYSPAMDALGITKALMSGHRLKWQGIEKRIKPAMVADSALRNQVINAIPGGVTYIDGLASGQKAGLRNLEQQFPDIDHQIQDIEDLRMNIKRCFFEDMMQMLASSDNPEMTAREIEERHSEKVLVLGPVMERMNDELFDPLIDRTFNLLERQGLIPTPPEEIQRRPLKVEYTSIMAQAMRLLGIANIDRMKAFTESSAQIYPAIIDKFDYDEAVDTYGDSLGINPKIIRTADQVKAIRDVRAKQQQAQQLASMAQPVERMAKAGKALGETDPENVQKIAGMMMGG